MARLVDDKGRLFGKINVVDLLVLVIILGLAVFVGVRFALPTKDVPVTITFLVEMYDQSQTDALQTLGPLEGEDGRRIGTITNVETYARMPVTVLLGDLEFAIDQTNRPAALVEVTTMAHVTDDGLHVGSLDIKVGVMKNVVGPDWEAEARIVQVEENATSE